jgi:ABC-2 type transport system ATP-binding protein
VLFLDEPTAGLDVEGRALIRDVIGALRADGIAVLLTGHDLVDIERVADRIVILDRGRVVAAGTMDELGRSRRPSLGIRFAGSLSDPDLRELADAIGTRVVGWADRSLELPDVAPDPDILAAVAAWFAGRGILIEELRTGGGSLEERYVALIGDTDREAVP